MLRDLKLEVFYPHPPEKVWLLLTNSKALAAWFMENNFEPRLGHKFQFQQSTLPGLAENIDCEVIELNEPNRLSFTWQDNMMCQPSIVSWTIIPVDGGTRLKLEHKNLNHQAIKVVEPVRYAQTRNEFRQQPSLQTRTTVLPSISVGRYEALDSVILSSFVNGGWEYKLNEKLPQILVSR